MRYSYVKKRGWKGELRIYIESNRARMAGAAIIRPRTPLFNPSVECPKISYEVRVEGLGNVCTNKKELIAYVKKLMRKTGIRRIEDSPYDNGDCAGIVERQLDKEYKVK